MAFLRTEIDVQLCDDKKLRCNVWLLLFILAITYYSYKLLSCIACTLYFRLGATASHKVHYSILIQSLVWVPPPRLLIKKWAQTDSK